MRLITRLDLDGIISAVMISAVDRIEEINFANPSDVENRMVEIDIGDAVAHLPLHPDARLWFNDHDPKNVNPAILERVRGSFKKGTSTARIVYEHYNSPTLKRFESIVGEVDRLQTANMTKDDITSPKGWILLAYTLDPRFIQEDGYGMMLVEAIKTGKGIDEILEMGPVKKRIERYFRDEERYRSEVTHYTNVVGDVIVTDFRDFSDPPHGNRFFVFTQYPEGAVHVRLDTIDIMRVKASVSKSIFNRSCKVHIGQLMEEFGGGGVPGAGTCMLNKRTVDDRIKQIIDRLK